MPVKWGFWVGVFVVFGLGCMEKGADKGKRWRQWEKIGVERVSGGIGRGGDRSDNRMLD